MYPVRIYSTEEQAQKIEPLVLRQRGVVESYLYRDRDRDLFVASDTDTSSFLRTKIGGQQFNCVYWDTVQAAPNVLRVYTLLDRMYSGEHDYLSAHIQTQGMNQATSYVYRVPDTMTYIASDIYLGTELHTELDGRYVVAEFFTVHGKAKIARG